MNQAAITRPMRLPCGLALKNRLVKAAMTEGLADPDGCSNARLEALYRRWSRGGPGLLITGNVQVDGDHLERPGNVIIDGRQPAHAADALRRWVEAAGEGDAELMMQLSHAGRQTPAKVNPQPLSASAVRLGLPGGLYARPRPMTGAEIEQLVERFADAAALARDCGFCGVQVHAAHGYLLSQFLSPLANRRDDEWGGRLENRARLLRRVVAAIRQRCGSGFALAVKLNSSDFQRGGFAPEDSRQVARWLAQDGIDLLEISGGTYEQPRMLELVGLEAPEELPQRASTRQREAFFEGFAAELRQSIDVPLMVTGGFRNAAVMNAAIEEDGIDLIGLGRPLCVAPESPATLLAGASELPRVERRIGRPHSRLFGVNARPLMLRALAGLSVMAWYYEQILRIGHERQLRDETGILGCFLRLQLRESRWLRARRRWLASLAQQPGQQ